MNIENVWKNREDAEKFSGVFSVSGEQGILFEKCCGYRNRSENLLKVSSKIRDSCQYLQ